MFLNSLEPSNTCIYRDHSVYTLNQWGTMLQCNVISLGEPIHIFTLPIPDISEICTGNGNILSVGPVGTHFNEIPILIKKMHLEICHARLWPLCSWGGGYEDAILPVWAHTPHYKDKMIDNGNPYIPKDCLYIETDQNALFSKANFCCSSQCCVMPPLKIERWLPINWNDFDKDIQCLMASGYTPAQRNWRGGILDSPCPSAHKQAYVQLDEVTPVAGGLTLHRCYCN